MNYNSIQFWILFGVILTTYWFANHRDQNRILLLGSYVFYGFWDYRFLCLILVSTIIDYIGGLGVAGRRVSKGTFWRLSLILMTVALCVAMPLKQMGSSFRNGNWNDIAHSMPRNLEAWAGPILVAVGIIFYAITLPWMYSLPEKSRRRVFLWVSMAANISILAFFKYFDFFIASGRDFAVWLGFGDLGWATFGIILPAGISFYTFQAMSYTIDIYRNECEPTEEFSDFALFVCFFPHLVAGPIMRAHTLLPQVINPRLMTRVKFVDGFYLILIGMFKKVVLADNLAPIADDLFFSFADGSADGRNFLDVLIGVYAFAECSVRKRMDCQLKLPTRCSIFLR